MDQRPQKTVLLSELKYIKLSIHTVRYNNGMEVLFSDGWYKVIFDNRR